MRTFVMGDLHGAAKALEQCLKRSGFNRQKDRLICLGDVSDGWSETKRVVEILLSIPNLVQIIGNHDLWTLEWLQTGFTDSMHLDQGGQATINSYAGSSEEEFEKHMRFFEAAKPFHYEDNRVFVHGGIREGVALEAHSVNSCAWNREMIQKAARGQVIGDYEEIFVGHTLVQYFTNKSALTLDYDAIPTQFANVWDLDTGAGYGARCSIMDIETKQFWQSDPTRELYPNENGR